MSASMSVNTIDAKVGLAKIAKSVLRCLVFTCGCYQIVLSVATVPKIGNYLAARIRT